MCIKVKLTLGTVKDFDISIATITQLELIKYLFFTTNTLNAKYELITVFIFHKMFCFFFSSTDIDS